MSLILALSITPFIAFSSSHAQDIVTETDTPVGVDLEATKSSFTSTRVNYELPYPGILPDNPFYFLKVLRDGLVKLLINDEMTMARFSLENAEKRLYAGKLLADKNKDELAVVTIGKSNNYIDDAMKAVLAAKKQNPKNPDIKPFLEQCKSAIAKHREILGDLRNSLDKEFMGYLEAEDERLVNTQKSVESLLRSK